MVDETQEPMPTNGEDENGGAETTQKKAPRGPTRYVAMIWDATLGESGAFVPVLSATVGKHGRPQPQEFQGRHKDVLQELESDGTITAEEGGWSPFVLVTPASHVAIVRAKIVTEKKVEVE